MSKFNNPLDNVQVASPCPASWNEMYGNDRKRFCGDCKLNVYNLSDMTRQEAEDLLINSEGRLCVRFFRRADGTVLTKNCPVGWQAVKQRASRVATAAFSIFAGLFTGILGVNLVSSDRAAEDSIELQHRIIVGELTEPTTVATMGEIEGPETFETVGVQTAPVQKKGKRR